MEIHICIEYYATSTKYASKVSFNIGGKETETHTYRHAYTKTI